MKAGKLEIIKIILMSLILLCFVLSFLGVYYSCVKTGYSLTTDREYNYIVQAFSSSPLPQASVLDADMSVYSVYAENDMGLDEHMQLANITAYYLTMFPDYDDTWLSCDILSYGRDSVCIRYSGAYTDESGKNITVDDNWYIDITPVRDGGYGIVYLNGKEFSFE